MTSNNLLFVTLREGYLGFKIGTQPSDIVLLFKDKNDLLDLDHSSILLGRDVGITAGPESEASLSATAITFKTNIYSYHMNNGCCTGVNLNGAILSYSGKLNDKVTNTGSPDDEKVNEKVFVLNMFGK
jgi:lipid-binding SYLF domain-containing protein